VGKSLALAYLDANLIEAAPEVTVFVVGEERTARILPEPPYDPTGSRLRDVVLSG
jgi:dimethylglycine dehydrogenase